MIYFLITTTFAKTLYFDIQKGNVITKEEHSNMFCKDILANLPPNGELHTGHFHILDTLFQQDIIVERQEFERVTEEQIDELYEQVKMSNMLYPEPIITASQWTSLLEIQPNEKDLYISQYDSIIEPWEILVYSGGHETQDGKLYVTDTLSASIVILRILKKEIQSKDLQLVRYPSKKTTGQYAFGIFLNQKVQKKEEQQTVDEWGVETTKGIFYPVSKNIIPGKKSLKNAVFWSYEDALEFSRDHTKKSHKKEIEIIEKETEEEETRSEEEEVLKLPPIKIVKRPPRQIQSAGEYLYLVFVLGGSLIGIIVYVRSYLKEKRTIQKAIEERKKREEPEF